MSNLIFFSILSIIIGFVLFDNFYDVNKATCNKIKKEVEEFCKDNNINDLYKYEMLRELSPKYGLDVKYEYKEIVTTYSSRDWYGLYQKTFQNIFYNKCNIYNSIVSYYNLESFKKERHYLEDISEIASLDKANLIQETFAELYSLISQNDIYKDFKYRQTQNKSILFRDKFNSSNKENPKIPKEALDLIKLYKKFFELTDKLSQDKNCKIKCEENSFLNKIDSLIDLI